MQKRLRRSSLFDGVCGIAIKTACWSASGAEKSGSTSRWTTMTGSKSTVTLRVDPKVARRERFNDQGAKSAGLFTKKRPGAKAGY